MQPMLSVGTWCTPDCASGYTQPAASNSSGGGILSEKDGSMNGIRSCLKDINRELLVVLLLIGGLGQTHWCASLYVFHVSGAM